MVGTLLMEKIPLLDKNHSHYSAITTDNHRIYLLSTDGKTACVYDFDFNFIQYLSLCKAYTDLCYDGIDHCFWGVNNNHNLYRLNHANLCEIDRVSLPSIPKCKLSNVAFDTTSNCLIVAGSPQDISICNKDGLVLKTASVKDRSSIVALSAVRQCILCVCHYLDAQLSVLKLLDASFGGEHLSCLPQGFTAQSMFSYGNTSQQYLFVLSQKSHHYPYVLKYNLICGL